jgi:manganese oxidase
LESFLKSLKEEHYEDIMKIRYPGSTKLIKAAATVLGLLALSHSALAQSPCERTIKANVVALDQAYYNNRIGAFQAGGMIFALRRDVVSTAGPGELKPGKVMLRADKRPRPIVLRANVGDCLQISFQNLLGNFPQVFKTNVGNQQYPVKVQAGGDYTPNQNVLTNQSAQTAFDPIASQPATRNAGVHVMGMELVKAEAPSGPLAGISADGSWVGANDVTAVDPHKIASGLVGPGERITYTFFAKAEGSYLLYSTAANVGEQLGFGGQLMQGLFGAVTVQPKTAEWYRSQVTKVDLDLATDGHTADGHPIIGYDKVYPPANPRAGQPILKMLNADNEIIYSDLTAIVTGPNHGRFRCQDCPSGDCKNCPDFRNNPTYPNPTEPYREFAIHYHDDFVSTQAFEEFRKHDDPDKDSDMTYTLQGSRDFFAINYGMGGIGPEIWSNRIGVGPMNQCATCRFEEFFLSSWSVGDPAMVVDFPANSVAAGAPPNAPPKPGRKATKALYPDDPSNVYHSYMGDHVKFQILHAGTNITHVHHLHAQQWLHSPNNDSSSYRDSQMISEGGSYTLNHTFNGSGNKNKTVGDAIFHCHFYPHFAQGMWALWRVHDVFEGGTELDGNGRPTTSWNRALPDGEIAVGSPIPAVVPLPTLPMAPIGARVKIVPVTVDATTVGYTPEVDNTDPRIVNGPGFPFFVPGVAGQRVPHPPLDFAPDEANPGKFLDGGLPRFIALKEVGTLYEKHNRWDFTKFNEKLKAVELPEAGTDIEKIAMTYHATRFHDTFLPDGTAATGTNGFVLNGLPPISGAPYADPAVELDGTAVCKDNKPPCLTRYKAADIQLDLVFNKKGQHYPQSRIITLWGDVKDTLDNKRAPEPFFFRANSKQVIEFWSANLVPNYYELDDFQVRTPTDILGQHIHLVKFDVTSSDGAANGFNYEDGTLSPQEVQEVIHNINDGGGLFQSFAFDPGTAKTLTAKTIPYFGAGPNNSWLGAQATVQRWYADPILDNEGFDRTLRTIFTHDHFGPSTHQQAGLYAGLLVEPEASKWQDPVSGVFLGTNLNRPLGADGKAPDDGGPTSWQANINTVDKKDSYREFALEFQDRQLTYKSGSRTSFTPYARYSGGLPCTEPATPWGWADPAQALNQPTNTENTCFFAPFPSIVTLSFQTGTYSLNYRNEAPAIRVNPNIGTPTPLQTDLSSVFRSIERADTDLNVQPTGNVGGCLFAPCFKFPLPQIGVGNFDPYTPMLRAYERDRVQIRTLVGAHMSPHSFTAHGVNWLFEPTVFDATNNVSGYRGAQGMGISEHYEMLFTLPRTKPPTEAEVAASPASAYGADYFYSTSSDKTGLSFGNWGLMRGYRTLQPPATPLVPLPNNQSPATYASLPPAPDICPADAPVKNLAIAAVFARDVLNGPVVYNSRGKAGSGGGEQIVNWNALAYFPEDYLDRSSGSPKLIPGKPVEPLILRANAGDCINITLKNDLPQKPLNAGDTSVFGIPIYTSPEIGLHPQLVALDVTRSNGVNAGNNPPKTVKPGESGTFQWYAGRIEQGAGGTAKYIPVEFGSIPLTPSDPLMQHPFGLIGALIIEPKGSSWRNDDNSRAAALVCKGDCSTSEVLFREFVQVIQDDVSPWLRLTPPGAAGAGPIVVDPSLKPPPSTDVPGLTLGLNYRSEPLYYRYKSDFLSNADIKSPLGVSRALSNTLVNADPQTPVFAASKDMPVRFRMIHPAGISEQVFVLHGHVWQEQPYVNGSTEIGNNPLSQSEGSRDGFGPNISFDAVIGKAGGSAGVTGDYLYRTFVGSLFQAGIWGLFRVGETGRDICTITRFSRPVSGRVLISGVNTVNPQTGHMAKQVTIFNTTSGGMVELGKVDVDPMTGVWPSNGKPFAAPSGVRSILVRSDEKGEALASTYITEPGQEVALAANVQQRRAVQEPDRRANELELFNPVANRTEVLIEANLVRNEAHSVIGFQWTLKDTDGKLVPIENNGSISIRPGDTVMFVVKDGAHGLTFPDGEAARRVFHFGMPGSDFEKKPEFGKKAIGTDRINAGSVIATLTVRKDIPPTLKEVDFFCTIHYPEGHRMAAKFVIVR